ncbi:MAG: hypothetical protein L3K19_00730 [Thermoplasmata archaeon]|nr:hypothetical protein [Thermoplasmata archaeon]
MACLVALWIGSGLGAGAALLPPTASGGAGPEAPSPPLIYHSALYVNDTAPTGSTASGEVIAAIYRVSAPSYPASAGPATVRIPSALVELPTSTGGIHLYLASQNLTVNGSTPTTVTSGPASRFATPLRFNATSSALLSSQGVAIMASWPVGAYAVQFRWQWLLEAPDGSVTYGPWSNASTVTPAQIADLVFPSGPTWTIGQSNPSCVAGAVAGRTFSTHLSTVNPSAVIVTATVSVPNGQNGQLCWSNTVPAGTTPQVASLHFWEYSNLTYELTVVLVQIVAASSGGGAASGGGSNWIPLIVLTGVLLTVLVVLEVVYVLAPQTLQRWIPPRLRRAPASVGPPSGAFPSGAGPDLPPDPTGEPLR